MNNHEHVFSFEWSPPWHLCKGFWQMAWHSFWLANKGGGKCLLLLRSGGSHSDPRSSIFWYFFDILAVICAAIFSGMYSGTGSLSFIYSDSLSVGLSGIYSLAFFLTVYLAYLLHSFEDGILCGITLGILSGISSGKSSHVLSGISPSILSGILSRSRACGWGGWYSDPGLSVEVWREEKEEKEKKEKKKKQQQKEDAEETWLPKSPTTLTWQDSWGISPPVDSNVDCRAHGGSWYLIRYICMYIHIDTNYWVNKLEVIAV